MREMKLQDLKSKTPAELVTFAEESGVENASTMRKQELMFAILKQLAIQETDIIGEGVVEVLSDGFGFLRSPDANYLPGPDDIYVSPSQIRRFGLRTGDTIEGHIRSPKEGERYFALLKVNTLNFEDPEKSKHKVNFDIQTKFFLAVKVFPSCSIRSSPSGIWQIMAFIIGGPAVFDPGCIMTSRIETVLKPGMRDGVSPS